MGPRLSENEMKSCALLPAVGKQNATFATCRQPGVHFLEIPCTDLPSYQAHMKKLTRQALDAARKEEGMALSSLQNVAHRKWRVKRKKRSNARSVVISLCPQGLAAFYRVPLNSAVPQLLCQAVDWVPLNYF